MRLNITVFRLDNGKLFVMEDQAKIDPFQTTGYEKAFRGIIHRIAPRKNAITQMRIEIEY